MTFFVAGIDALRIRVGLELPSASSPVSADGFMIEVWLTLMSDVEQQQQEETQ